MAAEAGVVVVTVLVSRAALVASSSSGFMSEYTEGLLGTASWRGGGLSGTGFFFSTT